MAKKQAAASGRKTAKPKGKAAATGSSNTAAKTSSNTAADAVDEQLARYRSMRHFDVTAEPSGGSA